MTQSTPRTFFSLVKALTRKKKTRAIFSISEIAATAKAGHRAVKQESVAAPMNTMSQMPSGMAQSNVRLPKTVSLSNAMSASTATILAGRRTSSCGSRKGVFAYRRNRNASRKRYDHPDSAGAATGSTSLRGDTSATDAGRSELYR